MKVAIIYRPNSDHGRIVEEFIRDMKRFHPDQHLEIIDVDTRDGSATATLYDVTRYPTIMVLQYDGQVQKTWEGDLLPRIDDVLAYARQ